VLACRLGYVRLPWFGSFALFELPWSLIVVAWSRTETWALAWTFMCIASPTGPSGTNRLRRPRKNERCFLTTITGLKLNWWANHDQVVTCLFLPKAQEKSPGPTKAARWCSRSLEATALLGGPPMLRYKIWKILLRVNDLPAKTFLEYVTRGICGVREKIRNVTFQCVVICRSSAVSLHFSP
jgi:hypothetical protein